MIAEKHDEIVKAIQESMSLTAPLEKITMKFIRNPEGGWNQVASKDFTTFMECSNHGVYGEFIPFAGVIKTGLCQVDHINHFIMSKTPVTDYVYRVLSNIGSEMDKGFQENFWLGVNGEKYKITAELIERFISFITI